MPRRRVPTNLIVDTAPKRVIERHPRRETYEQDDPLVIVPALPDGKTLDDFRQLLNLAINLGGADADTAWLERRVRPAVNHDAVMRGEANPVAVPPDAGKSLEISRVIFRAVGIVPET